MFYGKPFAVNEFTIKNFNKDSLLKDEPVEGTINLDSVKSNQFNIIIIKGSLSGKSLPEQIAIKIFKNEDLIDIIYKD